MRLGSFGLFAGRRLAILVLLVSASVAQATTYNVTINSPVLSGSPAVLVFDFVDGGLPNNTVTLSALVSNGIQGPVFKDGNITGTGPWTFSDAGGSFFNELQIPFGPMGSAVTFSFTTSDNAPAGGFPDAFSFFILGTDLITPLITTNDPTGANALFVYSIGVGSQGLSVYSPEQTGFSFRVDPVRSVPEPATLLLLAAGLAAWSARRRLARSQ